MYYELYIYNKILSRKNDETTSYNFAVIYMFQDFQKIVEKKYEVN